KMREETMRSTWPWPRLKSRLATGLRPRTTTSTPNIISGQYPRTGRDRERPAIDLLLTLRYGVFLLRERIYSAPLLRGGLLDDNKLGKSGHQEGSGFL